MYGDLTKQGRGRVVLGSCRGNLLVLRKNCLDSFIAADGTGTTLLIGRGQTFVSLVAEVLSQYCQHQSGQADSAKTWLQCSLIFDPFGFCSFSQAWSFNLLSILKTPGDVQEILLFAQHHWRMDRSHEDQESGSTATMFQQKQPERNLAITSAVGQGVWY